MQIRIEGKLGITLRIHHHQDRIDNEVFSLNLSNAYGLDIVNVIYCHVYLFIVTLLIVYS